MFLVGEMNHMELIEILSTTARLAQSAERKALNLVVVGSSPTVGALCIVSKISCRSSLRVLKMIKVN